MIKNYLFLICFILSGQLMATDYLMYIGAGGEDEKKDGTIFDSSIQEMAKYTKRTPNLKFNIALNGGHAKTEAIINKSFQNAETKSQFQASDYERLIQTYKTKLENNEIVSGDQLMIYVDTHGGENNGKFKTHSVASSSGRVNNFDTLSGNSSINLDELEILTKLAKAKGVKMAIVDVSCHSGSTLALADENTCVISSTGPHHYGYTSFSQNFIANMAKGKNLEEIFLKTRSLHTAPALPMISTPAGNEATATLYDKITPFLYYFGKHDKLSPYLAKNQGERLQCIANTNYNSLLDTINEIEELNTVSRKILWWKRKKKKVDLTNLKNLLEVYKKGIDHVQEKMNDLTTDNLNQKEKFRSTSLAIEYSWKSLLTTNFNSLISDLEKRVARETNPSDIEQLNGIISVYTQANARKTELISKQPNLGDLSIKEEKIRNEILANFSNAAAVGVEERKLFSALYQRAEKDQAENKANACKNFKL
jgi:hypothetical protein